MSLTVENLQFSYGKTQILKDLNVSDLAPGNIVGLIGPNASGKSTLFKLIAGVLSPKSGTISLENEDLATLSRGARAKKIAYMPQSFSSNAALNVFEALLLSRKHTAGWRVDKKDLAAVDSVISDFGIGHLASRPIGALSGGQQQMVAAAQCVVRRPDVLLLDEPTSALDLHHQLSILTLLRSIVKNENRLAILAVHDLNLAAQFCDRLLLLRDGKIIEDGPPATILSSEEVGATYTVKTTLETSRSGRHFVEASLLTGTDAP